ncbi:hypothetical protein EUTSA_v10013690mg [Eutrema salsugineum]|uniref:SOSEKI DIX-like domain-containing protein n=1 Tax=Eutrema salsugineum TaxID=72664 RepID=V4KSM9_EUTSA|nr:hypothetical protein EUTSA_v10013690mg [Eutrema salsugineum]
MEAVRSRRGRENNKSPERLIRSLNHQQEDEEKAKTKRPIFRRVQVVYYLTRNGHLEHPHFIEVISPVNQPLRLRDVMNRLTVLRGNGMPSLYAWSCKRNGFVWNDLAENDVIYPSDCAEYVLKGSEIAEKFEEVQVNRPLSSPVQEAPKVRLLRSKLKPQNRTTSFDDSELYVGEEEEEEEDGEYELDEEKTSYTSSTTPQSHCSRGVSTETIESTEKKPNLIKTEQGLPVRSDLTELTRSYPVEPRGVVVSERVEDGDPVDPGSVRGSIWLQMISCGHIAKQYAPSLMHSRQKEENLRKGVLCKNIVKKSVVEDEREMIKFMSENPRFGNPQAEEKEYFSGSIVESVSQERVTDEPALRRSNSFNEERSKIVHKAKDAKKKEEKEERSIVKVKCVPRRKSSSCLM